MFLPFSKSGEGVGNTLVHVSPKNCISRSGARTKLEIHLYLTGVDCHCKLKGKVLDNSTGSELDYEVSFLKSRMKMSLQSLLSWNPSRLLREALDWIDDEPEPLNKNYKGAAYDDDHGREMRGSAIQDYSDGESMHVGESAIDVHRFSP
jgi:hypothetical protein